MADIQRRSCRLLQDRVLRPLPLQELLRTVPGQQLLGRRAGPRKPCKRLYIVRIQMTPEESASCRLRAQKVCMKMLSKVVSRLHAGL